MTLKDKWKAVQGHLGLAQDGLPYDDTADAVLKALGLHSAIDAIMTTSQKGIALIKAFEGLELKAYPDPATGGAPWTIGVGHTGPEVKPGMIITEAQADDYLRADLARFEAGVRSMCPISTQNQFDAMVSLSFNVGLENFKGSTLRRLHNEGQHGLAADQFKRWNRANGAIMRGLTKRRLAEAELYRGNA
jgi:lysozyme